MIQHLDVVDISQLTMSWRKVLVDLALGEAVPGCVLDQLPHFDKDYELEPWGGYQLSDDGPTLHLVIDAAWLAIEVEDTPSEVRWMADSVDFHIQAVEAIQRGERPSVALRCFAWRLGMQADFAAGLRGI